LQAAFRRARYSSSSAAGAARVAATDSKRSTVSEHWAGADHEWKHEYSAPAQRGAASGFL
jgi:hypothetical protein